MRAILGRLPSLQNVALTVLSPFDLEAFYPVQHLFVHVGQDEPATSELCPVLLQRLVVEVVSSALFVEVAFADEKIGFVRSRDQSLSPLRVAGVRDDLVF